MSARNIRCYEYVNRPYAHVAGALRHDVIGVFNRATASAASRAESLGATLHTSLGPLEIGTDVAIRVDEIEEVKSGPLSPATRITLAWRARRNPGLFPEMRAVLAVYPLSPTETQIDLAGEYEPPLGALGTAGDVIAGHRVAEATVHRFVEDVAARLKAELP